MTRRVLAGLVSLIALPCGCDNAKSSDGPVLVFSARDSKGHHGLFQVALDGKVSSVEASAGSNYVVSPNGKVLAGIRALDRYDIRLRVADKDHEIDREHVGELRGVSDDGARVVMAVDRRAYDERLRTYPRDVVVVTLGGRAPVLRTIDVFAGGEQPQHDAVLSADGARLAYTTRSAACRSTDHDTCPAKLWIVDLPDGVPRVAIAGAPVYDYGPDFLDARGDVLTFTTSADGGNRVLRARVDVDPLKPEVVVDDAIWARSDREGTVFFGRRGNSSMTLFRAGDRGAPPIILRDQVVTFAPRRDGGHVAAVLATTPTPTLVILDRDGHDVARIAGGDRETYLVGWLERPLATGDRALAGSR